MEKKASPKSKTKTAPAPAEPAKDAAAPKPAARKAARARKTASKAAPESVPAPKASGAKPRCNATRRTEDTRIGRGAEGREARRGSPEEDAPREEGGDQGHDRAEGSESRSGPRTRDVHDRLRCRRGGPSGGRAGSRLRRAREGRPPFPGPAPAAALRPGRPRDALPEGAEGASLPRRLLQRDVRLPRPVRPGEPLLRLRGRRGGAERPEGALRRRLLREELAPAPRLRRHRDLVRRLQRELLLRGGRLPKEMVKANHDYRGEWK